MDGWMGNKLFFFFILRIPVCFGYPVIFILLCILARQYRYYHTVSHNHETTSSQSDRPMVGNRYVW